MLINEIRDDLREECEKFGVVKKVLLFDVSLSVKTMMSSLHHVDLFSASSRGCGFSRIQGGRVIDCVCGSNEW